MPVYSGIDAVVTAQELDAPGGNLVGNAEVIGKRKKISWNGSKTFSEDNYQGEPGVQNAPGGTKYEGDITYHHDPVDPGQQLLQKSFDTHCPLQLVVMPVGNNTGLRKVTLEAFVTDDPNSLALEDKVEKTSGLKINGIPAEDVIT